MLGFIDFVIDGKDKMTEVIGDVRPGALGRETLAWLRERAPYRRTLEAQVRELRMLGPDATWPPTDAERVTLARLAEQMRDPQGAPRPALIVEAGVATDNWSLAAYSHNVAWGYVVDLDRRFFEVYRGDQRFDHGEGRFAGRQQVARGSFPPAMVASWSLGALPLDQVFLSTVQAAVAA